jgi:hypothetical protein
MSRSRQLNRSKGVYTLLGILIRATVKEVENTPQHLKYQCLDHQIGVELWFSNLPVKQTSMYPFIRIQDSCEAVESSYI